MADDEDDYYKTKSFSDFMYNDNLGRLITFLTAVVGLTSLSFSAYYLIDGYLKKQEPVVQQQVLGIDKPEIYIERDGVKYFSHVDGKEISDLFSN